MWWWWRGERGERNSLTLSPPLKFHSSVPSVTSPRSLPPRPSALGSPSPTSSTMSCIPLPYPLPGAAASQSHTHSDADHVRSSEVAHGMKGTRESILINLIQVGEQSFRFIAFECILPTYCALYRTYINMCKLVTTPPPPGDTSTSTRINLKRILRKIEVSPSIEIPSHPHYNRLTLLHLCLQVCLHSLTHLPHRTVAENERTYPAPFLISQNPILEGNYTAWRLNSIARRLFRNEEETTSENWSPSAHFSRQGREWSEGGVREEGRVTTSSLLASL